MNILLLIISLVIYSYFGIYGTIYIILSILLSFILAKYLNKKYSKYILTIYIILNTIILLFLRICNYLDYNIMSIFGISYFTLQIISYLIDVYKNKYSYEKNIIYYSLYILYIPHLFIGPINRYDEFKKELTKKKNININNFLDGSIRIVYGLFKKLVIAGRISILISYIVSNNLSGSYALFAMLLYSIELFADFSGGIDIVLGVSNIFDIELPENFNAPFKSQTVKEFWSRWHITLGSWLKEYIYIPLGGNRCSNIRNKLNVLLTFIASGIWHGINYIIWGILNGILVITNFKTKNKYVNRIITFILISLLWSFFIWENSIDSIKMIISIFSNFNILDLIKNVFNMGLNIYDYIILIFSIVVMCVLNLNKIKDIILEYKLIFIFVFILIILVFGIYGIGFDVQDFIYSKF